MVAALTEEILNSPEPSAFPIESEHQLCRRFNISRVTVRLALSDLENRGLIYRKHGKGTYAHGRSTRVHRHIGVLMKSTMAAEHRPITEILRGVQMALVPLRSALLLISTSPEQWRPEKASSLGGVIVLPHDMSVAELEILKARNLPSLIMGESDLPGPHVMFGQREAARRMTEQLLQQGHRQIALLSGFDPCLDEPKRRGVHDALKEAGIDPTQVPEISSHNSEGDIFPAASEVLKLRPRPTAVVAFDDSLASILSFQARRIEGIKIPEEISLVSFHDWPYLNFIEPALHTVRFDFFTAGLKAAEALSQASLTGQPVANLIFQPTYRLGQTIGPVGRSA
ncbi:MAG: LacI family transcriptional regulator [Methylacidiphilales bacterium]|nr:LacI family transcriptional regulator [Candidatus Methylacidiphilales bacterium]